jgi:hypothetical protein
MEIWSKWGLYFADCNLFYLLDTMRLLAFDSWLDDCRECQGQIFEDRNLCRKYWIKILKVWYHYKNWSSKQDEGRAMRS